MAGYTNVGLNTMLDALGVTGKWISLHTSDPGATGAGELTGGSYTRRLGTWLSASGGTKSLSIVSVFDIPPGVIVRYVGIWSAQTGGLYYGSLKLANEVSYGNAGKYNLSSLILGLGEPVATRDNLIIGVDKPDATNTGVIPGTALTTVTSAGQLVATDGTVGLVGGKTYRNYRFEFFIAPPTGTARIRVENSALVGNPTSVGSFVGLAKLYNPGHCPMDFVDCTLKPQRFSRHWNGFHGHSFTALRCDISYVVDALSIFNTASGGPLGVELYQCYIHDFWWNAVDTGDIGEPNDPAHGNRENSFDGSHNDGVQLQGGTGMIFKGNRIDGFNSPEAGPNTYYSAQLGRTVNTINAPWTLQNNVSETTGIDFQFNWVAGGATCLNITGTTARNIGIIKNNKFVKNSIRDTKYILRNGNTADFGVGTAEANVFEQDGTLVPLN